MNARMPTTALFLLMLASCREARSPLDVIAPPRADDVPVIFQVIQTVTVLQPSDHLYGDADFFVTAVTNAPFPMLMIADGDCVTVDDVINSNLSVPDSVGDELDMPPDTAKVKIHLTGAGSCLIAAGDQGGLIRVGNHYDSWESSEDFKTFLIASGNAAPVLAAINGPADPKSVGTAVSISANFNDADAADTHSAVVNWDDGSQSNALITESNGAGSLTKSHTYANPGVYAVSVTLQDDDGAQSTRTFSYVVVFDPSAGFVTGGGTINANGSASFGFVARYQNGANAPTGDTEFLFQAGGINFKSTSYSWLVVSGAKAQFKGAGKINGVSGFDFLLSATDGQVSGGGGVDRFRIKIWNHATSVVVFDNQPGDADSGPATTALTGGSIVIHK